MVFQKRKWIKSCKNNFKNYLEIHKNDTFPKQLQQSIAFRKIYININSLISKSYLVTLWLTGPMQRMHDVGALFFLMLFPFPSIFRTPLLQKRRLCIASLLFWLDAHKRFPPYQQRRTHLGQPWSLWPAWNIWTAEESRNCRRVLERPFCPANGGKTAKRAEILEQKRRSPASKSMRHKRQGKSVLLLNSAMKIERLL